MEPSTQNVPKLVSLRIVYLLIFVETAALPKRIPFLYEIPSGREGEIWKSPKAEEHTGIEIFSP